MPTAAPRRRFDSRRREGGALLPPLLAGAMAAEAWMAGCITDRADPAYALLAGFGRLIRQAPVLTVFVPLWSAYPAIGGGDRDGLPGLRAEAADRLEAAAETGRRPLVGADRRSRLPAALAALLRAPVLTPKALAAKLRIAPQTATALLRVLQTEGVVKEVTGRGRFRAFAL